MTYDPSGGTGYLGHTDVVGNSTTYTDTGLSTLTNTDGVEVKGWKKTGTNGTFLNSGVGTATGPVLKKGVRPTGLDALRFNGSSNLLRNTDSALYNLFIGTGQDYTVYLVVGRLTADGNILMSWNPGTGDANNWGYMQARSTAFSPNGQVIYRDYDDAVSAHDDVDIGANNWAVVCIKYVAATTTSYIYTNADAGGSRTSGSGAATIAQIILGGLVRSGFANGQLFKAFDIGLIAWFNAAHSDAERITHTNGFYADSIGAPAAPTSPSATATYKGVFVRWTASNGATSYIIERSPDGSNDWTTIATVTKTNRTYYADTSLTSGNTYYYRVSASNIGGTSSPTSTVNATAGSTLTTASHVCPLGSLGDYWKPDGLASGAVSSWAGSEQSKALVQATGSFQPSRAAYVGGTAPYVVVFDGSNDFLTYDAGGPIFENDFTILYVLKLGSGAGRTGNENHWIAAKAGTNNQTLDEYSSRPAGAINHSDCRLNDGATEYSIGGWPIDTNVHLLGMTGNQDGYARLFYDTAFSKQQRIRPQGGALTFDMWTVGAHRRTSTDSWVKGDYGDIALWAFELNDDQVEYARQLIGPRYGIATTRADDPVAITESLVSGHWAAAIADAAGGAGTSPAIDNTSLGNNYQWTDIGGYTRELTNSTTSITYQTNESPTGLPAVACGSGGIWQETTGGAIAGEIDAGSAWTWVLVAKADSLSGSAQSLGCFTNNGATNAYVTLRVTAGGAWELASRDNSNNDHSGSGGTADTAIHCFIVTFDGNQTLKLFVDGTQRIALTLTASTLWTFNKHVLGGLYRGSLSEGFTDLRIFDNRVVAREVSALERSQFVAWANTRYGSALAPIISLMGGLLDSPLVGPGRLAR